MSYQYPISRRNHVEIKRMSRIYLNVAARHHKWYGELDAISFFVDFTTVFGLGRMTQNIV